MSFEQLKERQRLAWGAAPFEKMEDSIAVMHDDLVRRLEPQPGERWLDVGCGTGAVAMRAARAGADVTGLDLSDVMIATARRRAADEGLEISYDVGDAEQLPYPDAVFDVVSSSVGLFLAPDHEAVARELVRVARPGGRLGITCWRPGGPVAQGMQLAGRFQPPPPAGCRQPVRLGDGGARARAARRRVRAPVLRRRCAGDRGVGRGAVGVQPRRCRPAEAALRLARSRAARRVPSARPSRCTSRAAESTGSTASGSTC